MQSELLTIKTSSTNSANGSTGHILELRFNGSTKSNTLVLFLPFMGGSARTYDQVTTSLSTKNSKPTYLAISYPGTGATPRPASEDDQPEMCSVIPRAEQVLQVLHSPRVADVWISPRKLVIVAQSMSAKVSYVLLDMLARGRSSVAGAGSDIDVTGLVLLGPAPVGPLYFPADMREQQLRAYDTLESATWAVENILLHGKLSPEMVEMLASDCVGTSDGAKEGWMHHGMVFDCSEYVDRLKVNWPALSIRVMVGEEDKVEKVDNVRNQTIEVLKRIGVNIDENIVKGSGHLLPVEAVDKVVADVSALI